MEDSMTRHVIPILFLAAACSVEKASRDSAPDTTTAPPASDTVSRPDTARGARLDTTPAMAATDSGSVLLAPEQIRRGGVVVALAQGLTMESPRCSWKGTPLPCYRTSAGVRALVPLPADEPGGRYALVIDRPASRITREITVAETDFGRELIFLDDSIYAILGRGRDIARDARALRRVLETETPEQQWSGAWHMPVEGGKSSGYGVERFYYRASDSTRVVRLESSARARGVFGVDTASVSQAAPAWRHAGIDIAVPRGTSVRAPQGGAVAEVGDYALSGRTLILDHGQGVHSAFFHLDTVLVREGDVVRRGAPLARVGATGLATGPHLHYGIYLHGKDVDPAAWQAIPSAARDPGSSRPATKPR
jgi:murein DD-endopeptidase MepM/ murein hydrolase activator NlpD